MKKAINILIAASLVACSATPLNPGAQKIRITHNEPTNCKFLGDVIGSQGNAFTGEMTSNETMERGARNDIKNKAHALGGNVVYLVTQRAGDTGDLFYSYQSNVTLSGNVYKCPE